MLKANNQIPVIDDSPITVEKFAEIRQRLAEQETDMVDEKQ